MKICIYGNIASGKSTLAKKLAKDLDFSCFSIDDYRRRFNSRKLEVGERLSWEFLMKDASDPKVNAVIEHTGVSQYRSIFEHRLRDSVVFTIKVEADVETCKKHFKKRRKADLPPLPFDFDPIESIERNAVLLEMIQCDYHYTGDYQDLKFIIQILMDHKKGRDRNLSQNSKKSKTKT